MKSKRHQPRRIAESRATPDIGGVWRPAEPYWNLPTAPAGLVEC